MNNKRKKKNKGTAFACVLYPEDEVCRKYSI
jgi:hypothetical protein